MIQFAPPTTPREARLLILEIDLRREYAESIARGWYADEKDLEAALGCVRRAVRRERDRRAGGVT